MKELDSSWLKNIDPEGEPLNPEDLRSDVSNLLGKRPSRQLDLCYRIIHNNGVEPISVDEIYKKLYGLYPETEHDKYTVWVLISRIRENLGSGSIMTFRKEGYVTRRAFIEAKTGGEMLGDYYQKRGSYFPGKRKKTT